jgi:hypothetical protein
VHSLLDFICLQIVLVVHDRVVRCLGMALYARMRLEVEVKVGPGRKDRRIGGVKSTRSSLHSSNTFVDYGPRFCVPVVGGMD